jgi:hypothetical protein
MNSKKPLKLPSFLGVGPPRTGTTWLHETMVGHANLPQANKEIKFFDRHYDLGLDWYGANFDQTSSLVTGEICPTYFASAVARERIARLSPRPRIICTFRDPVVRVFSLYKMKRTYGDITCDFKEAIERDPELMESGRYAYHLAEWRRIFGEYNVLAAFYEDFAADAQSYVDRIADFAAIPRFKLAGESSRKIHSSEGTVYPRSLMITQLGSRTADWLKARHLGNVVEGVKRSRLMGLFVGGKDRIPPLSKDFAGELRTRFRGEIEALEQLVRRDLSAWKPLSAAG